jgi:hypothetical protein
LEEVVLVQTQQAVHVFEELEQVQRRVRVDLRQLDLSLLVFGALLVISAPFASWSGRALALYWLVAAPIGVVLVSLLAGRRGRERGVERSSGVYVVVAAAIAAVTFGVAAVAAAAGSEMGAAVAPAVAVGVAYLVLARLARAFVLALVAVGLFVLAITLWAAGVSADAAAVVLAEVAGGSMFAAGVGYWIAGRRRR